MKKLYSLFAVTVALVAIVFSAVMLYADVSPTVAVDYVTPTVQAVSPAPVASPSFWTYITQLPLLLQVFGSSFFASLLLYVAHFRGWLGTAQGKAELSDFAKAVPALEAMAADAGHPLSAQAQGVITQAIALAPKIATAFLLGFLTLAMAGQAKAGVGSLGLINLSPTAGAFTLTVEPLVTGTFYKATAGAILTPETDAVAGVQIAGNWGGYYVGIAGGLDREQALNYGCAGVVAGYALGGVELLWKEDGCVVGINIPLGIGAQVTP